MRMTASWFGSLDLPHTRLWRDSIAPESELPSDCHPDCIIVLEAVRMRPGKIEQRNRRWKKCVTLLDSKNPIQGPCAESEEKHEPASDADAAVVDSLKALDPSRPIREADSCTAAILSIFDHLFGHRNDLQIFGMVLNEHDPAAQRFGQRRINHDFCRRLGPGQRNVACQRFGIVRMAAAQLRWPQREAPP
jgi:hypothetical protein